MELLIFIGLQGAGKSSFYRARFSDSHVHVSKDNFRNNPDKPRRQRQLVGQALEQGQSVVVDNTNPTVADRADLIAQGREAGAKIVGYYFASQVAACSERNSRREGKERVPDVALYRTINDLRVPEYAEGFDELFYVRIGEDNEFVVETWKEEDERGALN